MLARTDQAVAPAEVAEVPAVDRVVGRVEDRAVAPAADRVEDRAVAPAAVPAVAPAEVPRTEAARRPRLRWPTLARNWRERASSRTPVRATSSASRPGARKRRPSLHPGAGEPTRRGWRGGRAL